jgi:PAS domain S-box-containing protein
MLNVVTSPSNTAAQRRQALVWLVAGNLLIAAVMLALVVSWQSAVLKSARDNERDEVRGLALSMSQTIEGQLAQVDLGLRSAMLRLREVPPREPARARQINAVLREQLALMPYLESLQLLDAQGRLRFGTGQHLQHPMDMGDSAHFQRARDASANGLVISEPVLLPEQQEYVLVVLRRLEQADGSFAGVIAGVINVKLFHHLFSAVDLGEAGAISLRTDSFRLVARRAEGQAAGAGLGSNKVSAELTQAVAANPQGGSYISATALDKIERINAFQRVGEHPLTVIIGHGTETFMQSWRTQLAQISLLSALAFAIVLLLSWTAYQSIRREISGRSQLEHALQRSQALLQSSQDAILVLNAQGTIVSANAALASLLGYHPDYLLGRKLSQFSALSLDDLVPPAQSGQAVPAAKRMLTRYSKRDGSLVDVELYANRVEIVSGALIYCSARAIFLNPSLETTRS